MKKTFILLPLTLSLLFLSSCRTGEAPTDLGVKKAIVAGVELMSLKECSSKPNCVISYKRESNVDHYLEPIMIDSNKERAYQKIVSIFPRMKGCKILKQETDYIQGTCTSDIFKYVDDVEFYFGIEGMIHFRSASRVGHWDMGANKSRIGDIVFKFHQNDF